jgi:hypothetical protein
LYQVYVGDPRRVLGSPGTPPPGDIFNILFGNALHFKHCGVISWLVQMHK